MLRYPISIDYKDGTKASILPERLWHAPEGVEYLVQLLDDGGAWCFSYNSEELVSREEAISIAYSLWTARDRKVNLRVIRVCRWTGPEDAIIIHSVVRIWGEI